jgi:hypothetical protein
VKKAPSILKLQDLQNYNVQACINGKWVPARSLVFFSLLYRVRAAWMVFTGKADALTWPEGQ